MKPLNFVRFEVDPNMRCNIEIQLRAPDDIQSLDSQENFTRKISTESIRLFNSNEFFFAAQSDPIPEFQIPVNQFGECRFRDGASTSSTAAHSNVKCVFNYRGNGRGTRKMAYCFARSASAAFIVNARDVLVRMCVRLRTCFAPNGLRC